MMPNKQFNRRLPRVLKRKREERYSTLFVAPVTKKACSKVQPVPPQGQGEGVGGVCCLTAPY